MTPLGLSLSSQAGEGLHSGFIGHLEAHSRGLGMALRQRRHIFQGWPPFTTLLWPMKGQLGAPWGSLAPYCLQALLVTPATLAAHPPGPWLSTGDVSPGKLLHICQGLPSSTSSLSPPEGHPSIGCASSTFTGSALLLQSHFSL